MSFYVFSGNDRIKIQEKIKKILGKDYEVFEGADLKETDLMEICTSTSLFAAERRILIRDLTPAREMGVPPVRTARSFDSYDTLLKYADTPHTIVIWESNTSLKKSFKDFCSLKQVTREKIDKVEEIDRFKIFKIFDRALVDGPAAAKEYRELKTDPYLAVGALAGWAINKYKYRNGKREERVLKEVAELDMRTKTSKIAPELLVESFIARLSCV